MSSSIAVAVGCFATKKNGAPISCVSAEIVSLKIPSSNASCDVAGLRRPFCADEHRLDQILVMAQARLGDAAEMDDLMDHEEYEELVAKEKE